MFCLMLFLKKLQKCTLLYDNAVPASFWATFLNCCFVYDFVCLVCRLETEVKCWQHQWVQAFVSGDS